MLLSYELAFDTNFQFVKGGKLPGVRGGPSTTGCDGGKEPNGTDCFSARLMWRKDAAGEGGVPFSRVLPLHLTASFSICLHPYRERHLRRQGYFVQR